MLKRLAYSLVLASAFVGAMVSPTFANDSKVQSAVLFPLKVVGSGVGCVVGVPLGAFRDGVKGGYAASTHVTKAMGDENCDCPVRTGLGYVVGGPVGVVGGAAIGSVKGMIHGLKGGYDQPFGESSFTYKDE